MFEKVMLGQVPQYVDMLESLRRGATVLYDGPGAMLLSEASHNYMLAATDPEEGKHALACLPDDARFLVAHEWAMHDYITEVLGHRNSYRCVQAHFDRPIVCNHHLLTICHPTPADWDTVRSNYHLVDEEELYDNFVSDDFFAAYHEGHLVGFAGLHAEGAMGMLYVLPEYRHRGFAEEITAFLVTRQHSLGRYAYAHIFADNEASINLQRKLGVTLAPNPIWWISIRQ